MGFLRPNKTIDVSSECEQFRAGWSAGLSAFYVVTLGPLPTEPLQSELRKEKFRISHMPVSTKEMGQSPLEFVSLELDAQVCDAVRMCDCLVEWDKGNREGGRFQQTSRPMEATHTVRSSRWRYST